VPAVLSSVLNGRGFSEELSGIATEFLNRMLINGEAMRQEPQSLITAVRGYPPSFDTFTFRLAWKSVFHLASVLHGVRVASPGSPPCVPCRVAPVLVPTTSLQHHAIALGLNDANSMPPLAIAGGRA
jgi:hypothetical protein